MDTMLIRWIIVLCGVSIGSSLAKAKENIAATKNDTAPAATTIHFDLSHGFKPKRQLEDFDFDTSSFDAASIFPATKINKLTAFDDDIEDEKDVSVFIPTSSFKVTRSNAANLGTPGESYEALAFPTSNFRSDVQPPPGQQRQSVEAQGDSYSSEDQDALSQVRQANTAYTNQVTTPYYQGYVAQPKYATPKAGIYATNEAYKPQAKIQYNPYQPITLAPVYAPLNQGQLQGHLHQAQQSQNTAYKTDYVQGLKNDQQGGKLYAPLNRQNNQQQSNQYGNQFQNYNPYSGIQYTTTPTVEINGKKLTLPVLQLQTAQNYPGYVQAYETTPIIYSAESGLQYKTEPSFGIFDFEKPKTVNANQRLDTNVPFLNTPSLGQIQVLPVQSASSTAQFPKYKGASVSQFPSRGFSKIPNDYQDFKSQRNLHFDGNQQQAKSYPKSGFYKKPLEDTRPDVEVLNKKKPPKDEDDEELAEDDSSEGAYKGRDSYFPKNDDDEVEPLPRGKYFKESLLEGDFKPSKSFPFKEYDKFSKIRKPAEVDEDEEDDEEPNVNLAAKYRYLVKEDEDEDAEEDEDEEKPKSKYKTYPLIEDFEVDEDEGESRRKERRQKSDAERPITRSKKSKPRKERGKSFADEFEESFSRKKNSKPKNHHNRSKGSTENKDSRPRSHTSFRKDETIPKSSKKNRHRAYRDESATLRASRPISMAEKAFQKSEEDSGSHSMLSGLSGGSGLGSSFSNSPLGSSPLSGGNSPLGGSSRSGSGTKSSKVVWEDSYELRGSGSREDDGGSSSYSKEEAAATDRQPNQRNPTTSGYSAEYTTKTTTSPSKESVTPLYDTGDNGSTYSSTHSPRTNWKTTEKSKPIVGEGYARPPSTKLRSLAHTKQAFFNPGLGRGELFRSLKGI